MSDETMKEKYLETLTKEVEALEYKKQNLESQIHSLQIKQDAERKLVEQEKNIKFAAEKERLSKIENELHIKKEQLELKGVGFKEREAFIERQEAVYAVFVKDKEVFAKEKSLFQEYKTVVEKDLAKAREEIALIESRWKELDAQKDNLLGMAKKLEAQENDLDQQLGILEQKKKDFDLYKQSEIEKYIKKEPVNV